MDYCNCNAFNYRRNADRRRRSGHESRSKDRPAEPWQDLPSRPREALGRSYENLGSCYFPDCATPLRTDGSGYCSEHFESSPDYLEMTQKIEKYRERAQRELDLIERRKFSELPVDSGFIGDLINEIRCTQPVCIECLQENFEVPKYIQPLLQYLGEEGLISIDRAQGTSYIACNGCDNLVSVTYNCNL
jgi:hypothetical protein